MKSLFSFFICLLFTLCYLIFLYLFKINIWIGNLLLLIGDYFLYKYSNKFIGYMGEFWVRQELKKLPTNEYAILNNIMVKTDNKTHQIDHVVISKYGIFVIETKQINGLITGNEYDKKWTQHLGKARFYFNNPIHQNYGHVVALSNILNIDKDNFISIVCISSRAKIKVRTKKNNVIPIYELINLIKSHNKTYIENREEIINIISRNNISDKKLRKMHIKYIKENIKGKEDENICPLCNNGRLVKRNGKYGNFIGCSNYPKCKFTKQIK